MTIKLLGWCCFLADDFMLHQVQYNKDVGTEHLKRENYPAALDYYGSALHILNQMKGQGYEELKAQLLCNRSLVHVKMKNLAEAQEEAVMAIQINPYFHKVSFY